MILTKELEVQIVGRNLEYYENLGYNIPKYFNKKENKYLVKRGTTITVKLEDLPKKSHSYVNIKCDYCGGDFKVRYDAYTKQKDNMIEKDCCVDCREYKNRELNLLRYGVKNQFQRKEVKDKIKNVIVEKYGVSHPMKSSKIKTKAMRTMSDNSNITTSRQQVYIHSLIGGVLNFNDDSTSFYSLDIADPNYKVFIEYDGSGHDLQITFGNMSEEEFKQSEIIRSNILRRNGWKEITIKSKKDFIPQDNIIVEMIDLAYRYLNNNHSWITFDIDEKMVICSQYKKDYDFGKLRKIYKNTLEKLVDDK